MNIIDIINIIETTFKCAYANGSAYVLRIMLEFAALV